MQEDKRPLAGIRVLEMGQLLAGPFTATMLAYFGAEVIKIEPPAGDPIRGWREMKGDTSLWWYSLGRNKKSITVDLTTTQGQDIALQLAAKSDVLIENFRPGVMENWRLGPEDVKSLNPGLVYSRISGFGQTGPYAGKPGYASVCEGISGFRYLNGFPGEAPVRPNLSIGDSIASLHAVIGILLALQARSNTTGGVGQVVDVALYESMFNLLEGVVPEYSGNGVIREPSGTTVTGIVPTNTYRCNDGKFVVIGGNGDSIFKRLMRAIGRDEYADDPALEHNAGRIVKQEEIDGVIAVWCAANTAADVIAALEASRVPVGPIYNVKDMMEDPHFQARGMFEKVEAGGEQLDIPALLPRLADTPGATEWAGPELGEHTDEVLGSLLAIDAEGISALKSRGVI